ncbi:MAG: class II aldolase/adducin family protein [Demequina sp.]|uniref:class II aldolase/adducin family protein n=1 Tax=Demequina sp. TaxID=2050685 RepID=UPI003A886A0D
MSTPTETLPRPEATKERVPAALPPVAAPRDREVRWELAAALRHLGALGYEFGFNGHVSARHGELPDHYWVNPFGLSIAAVTPGDLVLVDGDGEVVDSATGRGVNGFAGNLALHQQVADAEVAFHLHTPRGFQFSALGRPLEPVTTDAALVVGLQGLTDRVWGGNGGPSVVDLALEGKRVLVQRGHGFVTWGQSVGEAAFYLWAAERAADANLALQGHAVAVPADAVERWTLTPALARAHFEVAFTLAEAGGLA